MGEYCCVVLVADVNNDEVNSEEEPDRIEPDSIGMSPSFLLEL